MTSPKQLYEKYVQDRRKQDYDRCLLEDLGYLVRYTPQTEMDGWVTFSRLPAARTRSIIEDQIDHFRSKRKGFEWKVYGLDEPADLQDLLMQQGFVADDEEAFMLCPVRDPAGSNPHSQVCDIVRVETEQGVRDVVAVQEQVWKRKFGWLHDQLATRLAREPRQLSLYCAYVDGTPIGTGWTDFPAGSKFPELHGGAVLEPFRGRGIYKALYLHRLAEVASRRYQWIAVDASPMSRPILEKLGFIHVCNTAPLHYRAATA